MKGPLRWAIFVRRFYLMAVVWCDKCKHSVFPWETYPWGTCTADRCTITKTVKRTCNNFEGKGKQNGKNEQRGDNEAL